ncbi:tyrosine-type recombinase/integrase [uncultured Parabacteroides sp.]|uniref:tyrosine-type recombinase/integrase n=1 Tax=uncultured Parabacteroides sp. TaxID=512312 RepID=UPI00259B74CD|nr:tyrosine-type recombinase/integrase [uncultured Parabacteroides sp.]
MNIEAKQFYYPSLRDCVARLIERKIEADRERTAANYRSTWNKFSTFLGRRARILTITDLSAGLVQEFVMWLLEDEKSGNNLLSPGSQDFYLRNLKAIYNNIKKDLHYHDPAGNPFEGLHITVPSTRKRALPERDIKKLARLDLTGKPEQMDALHLSLFLFYARGMCFVDAYKLEQDNVHNGYIQYNRSKTQAILQVKITPEMHQIMQLYKRKECRWVFPFLHEKLIGKGTLTAQSSLHRMNSYLKDIGDELRLPYPLTTYVMRHSWASLMLEAGSEIGVISQSLGHMSLQTTEIYLGKLSKSKMDKASEVMLDNLVRPKSGKSKQEKYSEEKHEEKSVEPKTVSPSIIEKEVKPSLGSKWRNALSSLTAKLLPFMTT